MKKIFIICIAVVAIAPLTACMNGSSSPQPVAEALLEDADVVKWYNSDSKVSMTFSKCELFNEDAFGSAESFLSDKYIFTYDKQTHIATVQSGEKTYEFTGVKYNKFHSDETAICLDNSFKRNSEGIVIRFIIQPAGKYYIMDVSSRKYTYYGTIKDEERVDAASFSQK